MTYFCDVCRKQLEDITLQEFTDHKLDCRKKKLAADRAAARAAAEKAEAQREQDAAAAQQDRNRDPR